MSTSRDLAAHLRYFSELGATGFSRDPRWRQRSGDPPAAVANDQPGDAESAAETGATAVAGDHGEGGTTERVVPVVDQALPPDERLRRIREEIGECTRCKLHAGRTNLVFGVGNPEARLMFVGEGPGAEEDQQGEPFVGRAGQLLTQIIKAMGYARDQVYIANVVKCRPPGNRNPEPDEIAACSPFLRAQIASIRPQVIVALGKFAAQTLLRTETPISRLRGRFHHVDGVPVMPTFHPSYLLRNPAAKREVWEDMKQVMKLLAEA
ncbi:MAG TPA: uracil-DNA glycosylase [Vicinamibacterales bacterium]